MFFNSLIFLLLFFFHVHVHTPMCVYNVAKTRTHAHTRTLFKVFFVNEIDKPSAANRTANRTGRSMLPPNPLPLANPTTGPKTICNKHACYPSNKTPF